MKHSIDPNAHGPAGPAMAEAVATCVHCGFCLPDCPTYRVLGQEMDSPRGRIILMKEVLEGRTKIDDALPHIDRCLGCLACETTCPSGVQYGELISPFRDLAEQSRKRGPVESARRKMLAETLPSAKRLRSTLKWARFAKPLAKILPDKLSAPLELLPGKVPTAIPLPAQNPPRGERRATVALLAGCAQQVIAPEINTATIELLTGLGIEVLVPENQACCGALAWHIGDGERARKHARHNIAVFAAEQCDAVLTNAAGCGSGLHEYPQMLRGSDDEPHATAFADKVCDISVFLTRLGVDPPPPAARPLRIAYHDACHLLHAQKVSQQPRQLLRSIPNAEVIDLPDTNVCCGSAGTYNIEQPGIAADLGRAKAQLIIGAKVDVVASGNIGCLTQLRSHLEKLGADIPIRHTVEILNDAYAARL